MNLLTLPELDDLDIFASELRTDKTLLAEAESMPDKKKWEDMANSLFFSGGKLDFKDDLSDTEIERGTRFLRAWLMSFEPKHEEKALIGGLVLSHLVTGVETS